MYILYEATFWGYTRAEFVEGREKLFQSLEEAREETEKARNGPERCTTRWEEFKDFLLGPDEKDNPRAHELQCAVYDAESAFDQYCFDREIDELRRFLKEAPNTNEAQNPHPGDDS